MHKCYNINSLNRQVLISIRRPIHLEMNAITFFNRLYKFELLFHTQVNTPYVQSIDEQRLSNDLLDFSGNMKEKRVEYFRKALTIPLENIRYDTLCVTRMSENGTPLKKKIWTLIVKTMIENEISC